MDLAYSPTRLLAYSPTRLLACTSALLMLNEPAFSEPAILTPPVWDVSEDTDQDGLRDVDELLMFGLDPLDPSDGLSDDDGDLLSMAWEIFYETDPNFSDTDEDTWSDGEELLIYGTDPLDPLSFPQGIDENGQKTTETPSPATTFAPQTTAALVQTPPPPSLSNGEFNDLVVTNFRHNTGKDYQGKVFDWGSSAGDDNGWIAYNGSLIEVWKSGNERFIELDGWKEHYGVKQPIANVAPGSYVLTWQQSGRTNTQAFDNAYKVQVYYLKGDTEVIIAETEDIAHIDKTKWTPNGLGFNITEQQIADANGSPIYVAFIPKNNNTYGTLIDKVGLATVDIQINTPTQDDDYAVVSNGIDPDLASELHISTPSSGIITANVKMKGIDGSLKFEKNSVSINPYNSTMMKIWGTTASSGENTSKIEVEFEMSSGAKVSFEEDLTIIDGVKISFEGTFYSPVDTRDYRRRPHDGVTPYARGHYSNKEIPPGDPLPIPDLPNAESTYPGIIAQDTGDYSSRLVFWDGDQGVIKRKWSPPVKVTISKIEALNPSFELKKDVRLGGEVHAMKGRFVEHKGGGNDNIIEPEFELRRAGQKSAVSSVASTFDVGIATIPEDDEDDVGITAAKALADLHAALSDSNKDKLAAWIRDTYPVREKESKNGVEQMALDYERISKYARQWLNPQFTHSKSEDFTQSIAGKALAAWQERKGNEKIQVYLELRNFYEWDLVGNLHNGTIETK